MSFPRCARSRRRSRKCCKREEESFNQTPRSKASRSSKLRRIAPESRRDETRMPITRISRRVRLSALRRAGFSARSDRTDGARTRAHGRHGRLRDADGGTARAGAQGAKEKRHRSRGYGRPCRQPTFSATSTITPAPTSKRFSMLVRRKRVALNNSVLYAEMGGQVGDQGEMIGGSGSWRIEDTRKSGDTWLHFIAGESTPAIGEHVTVRLDRTRRGAIERHHTVTHLLHWALHEVVSRDATQKGSYVGPEKLTFDFSSAALTTQQVREVEKLVNEKHRGKRARLVDGNALRRSEAAHRHHAVLRRQIRRPCARGADRRQRRTN